MLTKTCQQLESRLFLRAFDRPLSVLPDTPVVLNTDLAPLPLHARGKVRDIYDLNDSLLLIATDRISAFDHVLGSGIPNKGRVLTQLSLFWFDYLKDVVPNHVVSADTDRYPEALKPYLSLLRGRSMMVSKAQIVPVECVVRGYLSGSGWKEYQATGSVCGIALPAGLKESARLAAPIFTPAIKATSGHDENIPYSEMVKRAGPEVSAKLRDLSLRIYEVASQYARDKGILIADTKFEFGMTAHGLVLADEVLTPDSSRFWPQSEYRPGGSQPSFDKQFVRDYLEKIGWNKQPPAPELPADVVNRTGEKYMEALRRLTGRGLQA